MARDLLGKFIVRDLGTERISGMITEIEAYKGPRDRACHASGGRRTPRVEAIYARGGTVYVYFVYGMHWMLNFATAGEGLPEAVLVRGIAIEQSAAAGAEQVRISGPGRVARHLRIDERLYGVDACVSEQLWLEDRGVRVPPRDVRTGPRVGIDFAGAYWAARPWRFWVEAPR